MGHDPIGDGPFFCCTGCEVVHDALHAAGLDASYYKLQDRGRPAARIEEEVILTPSGAKVISLYPAEELPIANPY